MSLRVRFSVAVLFGVLGLFRGAGVTQAEDAHPRGASVPLKVVAGRLVLGCDLSTRRKRVPVTLFVDLDRDCGLLLHDRVARAVGAENDDGTPNALTLHLPDLDLPLPARGKGPEQDYEDFSRLHAPELGEVALVGTLGGRALAKFHLVLDLHNGRMLLAPPRAPEDPDTATDPAEPSPDPALAGGPPSVSLPLTVRDGRVWFTVRLEDDTPGAMALGTSLHDTTLARAFCRAHGAPGGDVGPLRVRSEDGALDLSRYVAFRPEPLPYTHPDGAVGVTGLNLLEHLRVEVDRVNARIRFTQSAPPVFPEADRAWFLAREQSGGDPVEAWLQAWPDARLGREASRELVRRRREEGAAPEVFERALLWLRDSEVEDLRATVMLDLMKSLVGTGGPESAWIRAAGRLGIEKGRTDRYPNAVHEIHLRLGEACLEAGDDKEAWRHLLSAAFGMPQDGRVNLSLGRFYEQGGRLRRAYSRYVQAVVVPETGAAALQALERLQPRLPGDERFSVDLIERLIAGRVENFGTATRFKPTEASDNNSVALAEFFTNAHFEGALGAALGHEGMLSYFPRDRLAVLSYHLPEPALEPLVNELAVHTARRRGVSAPRVHRIVGLDEAPGAARLEQKEEVYNILREIVLSHLYRASKFTLSLEAQVREGIVSGELVVKGPERKGSTVQIVLAERGVLYPGRSKVVIHRMVARAALTGSLEGIPWEPVDGVMRVPFRVALADITRDNVAYLKTLSDRAGVPLETLSTTIDPEQVTLVAYVRGQTGQITQALQVDPRTGP